jgi:molybdopterin-binding protein
MGATSLVHVQLDSAMELAIHLSAQSALEYSVGQEVYVQANGSEIMVASQ